MDQVGFGIIAACLLLAALFVVTSRNLVHGVLWLAVTLSTTAALYAMLGATFLATVQIILYTGGIITLMLFGVMLTRRHDNVFIDNETSNPRRFPALLTGAAMFGIVAGAVYKTDGLPVAPGPTASAEQIGRSFLTEHLLAFEVLSLLLLAAMIGAIVIARKLDFGQERQTPGPARRKRERTA